MHLVPVLCHDILCSDIQYFCTPNLMSSSCFLWLNWTRTFLTQSTMNEISRLSEERAQVKVFTVWCFYSVILYVGVFVETWPGVNVLGAVCSVHHVCYSQTHQQGFTLSCGPVNDTRDDTRSAARGQLCEHTFANTLVTQMYRFYICWPNAGLVCTIRSPYCSGTLK